MCLLVDCLTVWLGNLMHHGCDVDAAREALLESLAAAPGPVVLVANEVGLGIVPDSAMARAFRDDAGRLNQAVAGAAGSVYFVVAGLPMTLKGRRRGRAARAFRPALTPYFSSAPAAFSPFRCRQLRASIRDPAKIAG